MKAIIVFGGDGNHPTLGPFARAVYRGFLETGNTIYFCNCTDNNSIVGAFRLLHTNEVAFTVGFNNFGMEYTTNFGTTFPLHKEFDVPHVSITLDVPYNQHTLAFEAICPKHIVTLLDRNLYSYTQYIDSSELKHYIFMPLAGIEAGEQKDVFELERYYDVVMCATCWGPDALKRTWREGIVKKRVANIMDDIADCLETEPINTWQAVQYVLKTRGLVDTGFLPLFIPYMGQLLRYIKTYRRIKSVEYLVANDIRVNIFGGGWEDIPLPKTVKLHGAVSHDEAMSAICHSKVLYQDQAEFNNGAHDRVFTGMLNGSVIVSEYSTYLAEEFVHGEDIFLYDWQHGMEQVGIIPKLLQDESHRLNIAKNAYIKAYKNHRWVNRAEEIIEAVDLLYGV